MERLCRRWKMFPCQLVEFGPVNVITYFEVQQRRNHVHTSLEQKGENGSPTTALTATHLTHNSREHTLCRTSQIHDLSARTRLVLRICAMREERRISPFKKV